MLFPSHGVVDFTHVEDCIVWFVYYTPCKSICLENLIFAEKLR